MIVSHGKRRWLLVAGGLVLLATVATLGGFAVGRRWPFERLERLQTKLFGEPSNDWAEFATTDLPRYELARVLRGTSLYLFSGFTTNRQLAAARVEVLDLDTGVWTRKQDMPQPLTHAAPVILGDTVWFAGGFEGNHPGPATSRVWLYDLERDRWSTGPPLPAPRGGGGLVAHGDTLHYFGGWLPDRNTDSPDHWTLVVGDDGWRTAPPLPMPRGHLSSGLLDGKIYALGGAIGHDPLPVDVDAVHRFDPTTGRWEEAACLPFVLSHAEPATMLYDGRILLLGGRSRGGGREVVDDVVLFDAALERWLHLGRVPEPVLGAVGVTLGDTLFAGLGAANGSDPKNLLLWRTTLRDTWRRADAMPVPLGEVAGGIIDGKLYLVGQGPRWTLAHDLATGRWGEPGEIQNRPAAGHHHAAEVVGGRLFLLGGIGRSSPGVVQIYDPKLDEWRLGPAMPFAAGSNASAVIDGKIYVAGGIVAQTTVGDAAVLDPAMMQWTSIAPMPRPRSQAASATDGKRLFVFGGRGPGSGDDTGVMNGFDDVQIYDPASDTWRVSDASPSAPAPLPRARGGMGKAVWLDGEFWIIGGETEDGPGAPKSGTCARVDIFDPVANSWRAGPELPTARRGIFPLADAGMIYVAGGGSVAGESDSDVLEILWPRQSNSRR